MTAPDPEADPPTGKAAPEPLPEASPAAGPPPEPAPEPPPGPTYPDAPEGVIARWQSRRHPVPYRRGEALPPLDVDLAALAVTIIPLEEPAPAAFRSPYRRKMWKLRRELAGRSELALLNAYLIVNLRRETYPEHTPALFRRIWSEQGANLMHELSGRWLISSVITFGDIGETESQRRIGLALNVLFSTMKLYESERTFSGVPSHALFRRRRMRRNTLPLGMTHFSFASGGLDYNLLAPIWQAAQADPVVGPLACHLLDRLNHDPGNIFRRIKLMNAAMNPVPLPGDDESDLDDLAYPDDPSESGDSD
jgi:hypothetical protein